MSDLGKRASPQPPATKEGGDEAIRGVLRATPEDFVVHEIDSYATSGEGDHVWVRFEKRAMNSRFAVKKIAEALKSDPKHAGLAGQKDRHAVTRQRASFLLPGIEAAEIQRRLNELDEPGLTILDVDRHGNKMKTGHLKGNRFSLVLRDLSRIDPTLEEKLARVQSQGVPNLFGPQRFGHHGSNLERARQWLVDGGRPPRDKKQRRFLFSALQSAVFNRVTDLRLEQGTWNSVVPGDVVKRHDSGGLFVPATPEETTEAVARALKGEVSATGPIWGAKMKQPGSVAQELEQQALKDLDLSAEVFAANRRLGEGTRRPLRLWVADFTWKIDPSSRSLSVDFVLEKGGYATTVVDAVVRWSAPLPPKRENRT